MIGVEIVLHDGPARLGRLSVGGILVPTPAGCFFIRDSEGLRCFEVGEGSGLTLALTPSSQIVRSRTEEVLGAMKGMIVFGDKPRDASQCKEGAGFECRVVHGHGGGANDPGRDRFVLLECRSDASISQVLSEVARLRRALPPSAAIMVPDAEVWSFPLLALAGVDLFGDSHALGGGLEGEMIFESYSLRAGRFDDTPCMCPHCNRASGERGKEDILGHNRWMTRKVLSEIRTRIRLGQIKHLAEERSVSHPSLHAALKLFYRDHADYLEEHTTVVPGSGS